MAPTITAAKGRPKRRPVDTDPTHVIRRGRRPGPNVAAPPRRSSGPTVAADLAALPTLDLAELRQRWRDAFGIEPLARISPKVLVAALGHHAQEQAVGGLPKKTVRRLEKLA